MIWDVDTRASDERPNVRVYLDGEEVEHWLAYRQGQDGAVLEEQRRKRFSFGWLVEEVTGPPKVRHGKVRVVQIVQEGEAWPANEASGDVPPARPRRREYKMLFGGKVFEAAEPPEILWLDDHLLGGDP